MFKVNYSYTSLVLVLALAATQADAQILAKDCEACTQQQVMAVVKNCANGYDYVGDFRSHVIYKSCWVLDVNDGGRRATRTHELIRLPVESSVRQSFERYYNVYANNGLKMGYVAYLAASPSLSLASSSMGTGFSEFVGFSSQASLSTANDNGSVNAFDTVVSSADNQRTITYLSNKAFSMPSLSQANPGFGPALVGAIAQLENSFKSQIISFSNFNATYVVEFSDGSTRVYAMDFANKTFKAVPGTAKDAHGNIIPENTSMVSHGNGVETYNFRGAPGYDVENFVDLAKSFGAKIDNSAEATMFRCVWQGSSDTLNCTAMN